MSKPGRNVVRCIPASTATVALSQDNAPVLGYVGELVFYVFAGCAQPVKADRRSFAARGRVWRRRGTKEGVVYLLRLSRHAWKRDNNHYERATPYGRY